MYRFGQPKVDLFATNNNTKCRIFCPWFPYPEAKEIDAFSTDWSNLVFYAFPPFAFILKVIRKIINDQAEGILVVPNWPSRLWFPLFNELLVSPPIYFVRDIYLLRSPFREFHTARKSLTLVEGKLSGERSSKSKRLKIPCSTY